MGKGPRLRALALGMPLITLLTDYGTSDSYVAEMKGVLLDRCPGAVLVDVTHAVPPGDLRAGAYLLGRAWPASRARPFISPWWIRGSAPHAPRWRFAPTATGSWVRTTGCSRK